MVICLLINAIVLTQVFGDVIQVLFSSTAVSYLLSSLFLQNQTAVLVSCFELFASYLRQPHLLQFIISLLWIAGQIMGC